MPIGPPNWFKADDYPMQFVEAGVSAEIKFRITVRPDGGLQGCAIEESGGNKDFDKYTCALTLSRAKFAPARSADGTPIIGVHRARVTWMMDDRKPTKTTGDLELTVAKLPSGLDSPTFIGVAIAVDSAGRPSECASTKAEQNAALVRVACAELVRTYRAIPARLPSGELVPSVQTASVKFISQ